MVRNFWIDAALATIFIFILMWGIFKVTQLRIFDAFDPIGQAIDDMELTDYVFSQLREDPPLDTNIVIVNFGELSRRQVAEQIRIISQHKPKVIGIDGFYNCQGLPRDTVYCPQLKDTLGNLLLAEAIREAGNVILVTKLLQSSGLQEAGIEDVYDSLEVSDSLFTEVAMGDGFASLETEAAYQDDVKTCRAFNPKMSVNGVDNYAFGVRLAMAYDPEKTKRFLDRDNYSEVINYRGNIYDIFGQTKYPQVFYTLDVDDVLNDNFLPSMIEGKIVIVGFLGKELGDPSWGDKFFTPLNLKMAGKANPDMFGAVVHGNIASMIINEDYIDQMSEWQEWVMAVVLCYLNVALFSLIYKRLPDWYDGMTKVIQIVELLLFTILMVVVFDLYNFKLEVTISLAAIALVGDSFEVYSGLIKNLVNRIRRRKVVYQS